MLMRILIGTVEEREIPKGSFDSEDSVLEIRFQVRVIKVVRTKLAELEGFHLSMR